MATTRSLTRWAALAPLRVNVFRGLWIAAVVSNIGNWMQTVGAQWLLIHSPGATALVALVQTASAVPVVLLAVPAGVLGEFVNKRTLLIAVQAFQVIVAVALTILTAAGLMPPALLLTFTFLLGAASAVQLPAYQALVPELVPREQLPNAAALSSIGVNVARAIGPAVGGLIIAGLGVPAVFALDTATFVLFGVILISWRGYTPPHQRAERLIDATRAGGRYVWHSPVIRSIYVRLGLFLIPANALWALLPLLAQNQLKQTSAGYGLLLTALGVGSIVGALLLPPVRARLPLNTVIAIATALYGAGLIGISLSSSLLIASMLCVITGVGWIAVIATMNAATQSFLPPWVRSRGLSFYQVVLYGCTAIGAAVCGAIGQFAGILPVTLTAGIVLLLIAVIYRLRPLVEPNTLSRDARSLPLSEVPDPGPDAEAGTDRASTLVLVDYNVPESRLSEFVARSQQLENVRRRTGARTWDLYHDRERDDVVTEAFTVGSWDEHLAQHETRLTEFDLQILEAAKAFSVTTPQIRHYTSLIR